MPDARRSPTRRPRWSTPRSSARCLPMMRSVSASSSGSQSGGFWRDDTARPVSVSSIRPWEDDCRHPPDVSLASVVSDATLSGPGGLAARGKLRCRGTRARPSARCPVSPPGATPTSCSACSRRAARAAGGVAFASAAFLLLTIRAVARANEWVGLRSPAHRRHAPAGVRQGAAKSRCWVRTGCTDGPSARAGGGRGERSRPCGRCIRQYVRTPPRRRRVRATSTKWAPGTSARESPSQLPAGHVRPGRC